MKGRRSTSLASWWPDSVHVGPVQSGPATAVPCCRRTGTSTLPTTRDHGQRPDVVRRARGPMAGGGRAGTSDRAHEAVSTRAELVGGVRRWRTFAALSCVACPDAPDNLLRCTLPAGRSRCGGPPGFARGGVEFGAELDENGAAEQTLGRSCDARAAGGCR